MESIKFARTVVCNWKLRVFCTKTRTENWAIASLTTCNAGEISGQGYFYREHYCISLRCRVRFELTICLFVEYFRLFLITRTRKYIILKVKNLEDRYSVFYIHCIWFFYLIFFEFFNDKCVKILFHVYIFVIKIVS